MSVIFHMLKEEFERLQETEKAYFQAIADMPRGAPRVQKRRNRKYLYLEYRDGDRIVHEYVGPEESEKAKEVKEKVNQRRRYEKLLKETRVSLKEVRKALRGKI